MTIVITIDWFELLILILLITSLVYCVLHGIYRMVRERKEE